MTKEERAIVEEAGLVRFDDDEEMLDMQRWARKTYEGDA